MAADKFGRRVDHDVGPVLDGADEKRCAECVVDYQRKSVAVGYRGDSLDVDDVGVGVTEGLDKECLGVGLYRTLKVFKIFRVNKGGGDAVGGQRVVEQIVGAAVDCLCRDDMVACRGDVEECIGDCRGARCTARPNRAAA